MTQLLLNGGGIYALICQNYERNCGQCVMDSAFARNNHKAILKSAQNPCDTSNEAQMLVFRVATSLCQSAEWGMHTYHSSLLCLNEHIPCEENGEQLIIFYLATLLYNF